MNEPPRRVRELLSEIAADPAMNEGLTAMMSRKDEFDSMLGCKLAGVYLDPVARLHWDRALDDWWSRQTVPSKAAEVIVGAGLHAAIYSAVRVARGFEKPLVLEQSSRVGGNFAVSRNSTFFLNSRNRPGRLGVPGRGEALNYLPEAAIQPSELSGDEYQPNGALAFVIRATLAMNAKVVTDTKVSRSGTGNAPSVVLADGTRIRTPRIVWATGLGKAAEPPGVPCDGEKLMTYPQFLAHLDKPMPFRRVKRVAVIGAGDAGRTVIEALIGQGPSTQWTTNSLDYIQRIDWYGVPDTCMNQPGWEQGNRSRYAGIGRALPRDGATGRQIKPINGRANSVGVGYDGAYVDGALYDLVVWATGFVQDRDYGGFEDYTVGGRMVGGVLDDREFVIGPASGVPLTQERNIPSIVPENAVAIFQYADRTATLAASLDGAAPGATSKAKAEPTKDKTNYRFWEKGDKITLNGKVATVASVTGNEVRISDEKPADYSEFPRTLIKPREWKFMEKDKSDPNNWEKGDKLVFYDNAGSTGIVYSITKRTAGALPAVVIEQENGAPPPSDGGEVRGISPDLWRYAG